MKGNATYKRMIQSRRWLKLRRDTLTAHPCCVMCGEKGLMVPATEVHHIVPAESASNAREMSALMFDPSNLMPLCHTCHVEVHKGMGRSGKAANRRLNDAKVERIISRFFGEDSKEASAGDGSEGGDPGGSIF